MAHCTASIVLVGGVLAGAHPALPTGTLSEGPLSPVALVAAREGTSLWIACSTGQRVLRLNTRTRKVEGAFPLPSAPSGLALSLDETRLLVTCASPRSSVCVLATADGKLLDTLEAGHTAGAPVLGPDGRTLYVCNRFDHDVSVIDLVSRKERTRVRVRREPTAAALTSDGRFLLVANHLHDGRADANHMAAVLSVMDTAQARVVKELVLPDGSGVLQDLRISPDGRYAVVSHLLGRYPLPTTELERGWMNTNAKTLVDVERLEVVNTILLDSVDRGAANPWGVGWSADTAHLVVAHAGTHELSVIDFAGVLARLKGLPAVTPATGASIQAPYLGPDRPVDVVRQGEAYFHDAALWFQGWQSCASCHPGEGRVDALDWDLLNDGVGNPKNNRSLLLSHRAPPAMSMGIRETADSAIRAGLEHVLFTVQPDSVAVAMGEYLKALTPVSVGNGTWDVKVILGETPVHRDGSALFQVPARMPAYVQAIDSQGFAVKTMRS